MAQKQSEGWKRYLEAGMAFTEMTRERAQELVRDLVKAGEVQRDRAQETVDEILERSRKSAESLVALIRQEVRDQLQTLGLLRDEGGRPPRRTDASRGPSQKAPAPKKAPAAKTTKTSTAKKAASGATKRPAAKKAGTASKTTGKKAAKKGPGPVAAATVTSPATKSAGGTEAAAPFEVNRSVTSPAKTSPTGKKA